MTDVGIMTKLPKLSVMFIIPGMNIQVITRANQNQVVAEAEKPESEDQWIKMDGLTDNDEPVLVRIRRSEVKGYMVSEYSAGQAAMARAQQAQAGRRLIQ